MQVRFGCGGCDGTVEAEVPDGGGDLACPRCGRARRVAPPGVFAPGPGSFAVRCSICPSDDLYLQRDFPRRAGLAIMAAGGAAFLILAGWYERVFAGFAVLAAVALLDGLLFRALPVVTACYRCRAELRGLPPNPSLAAFDHHLAEDAEKRARIDRADGADGADAAGATGGAGVQPG